MKMTVSLAVALSAALLLSVAASAQTASAQGAEAAPVEGEGISLAPARFKAEMSPGTETTFVVNLNYRSKGTAQQPTRINVSLNDWTMTRGGQVEFAKAGTLPNSGSPWILYSPAEAAVTPGQVNSVRVTVTVPADAAPGDHLAALIIEPRPDNLKQKGNERQVSVRYRMASMIYVKVSKLTTKGSLEGLKARAGERGVTVTPTLRNDGNSVVRPLYAVKITDATGRVVAELPEAESLPVLAGNELSQPLLVGPKLEPGKYSVSYRVNFQGGGKEIEGVTELLVKDTSLKSIAQN